MFTMQEECKMDTNERYLISSAIKIMYIKQAIVADVCCPIENNE